MFIRVTGWIKHIQIHFPVNCPRESRNVEGNEISMQPSIQMDNYSDSSKFIHSIKYVKPSISKDHSVFLLAFMVFRNCNPLFNPFLQ